MRYVSFLYLLMGINQLSVAQPRTIAQANQLRLTLTGDRPDTQQVHTRLRLVVFYLQKTLHVKQSLDSALTMAQQAKTIAHQLHYTQGAEDAVFLQGSAYIRQGKANLVEQMLYSVSDTNHIRLLLELGKSWLRSTLTKDADWGKARSYFKRAEVQCYRIHSQRWQEESQLLTGMSYVLAGDWPASKAYFLPIIQARRQAGDREGELWVCLKWLTASLCENCQEQTAVAGQLLSLAQELADKPKQVVLLTLIGYNYGIMGNKKLALRAANQAVAMYKVIGPKPTYQIYAKMVIENDIIHRSYLIGLATPSILLADIHKIENNLDQELRYYFNIIDEAERSGLVHDLDYLYFMVGNVYYEWKQYDKSIEYYQQSLALSHQQGEVVIHVGLIRRLVASLLKLNKVPSALTTLKQIVSQDPPVFESKESLFRSFGDCYLALKQYRLAEAYYLQALRRTEVQPNNWGRNLAWLQLGQFYVTTGQFTKAKLYLDRLKNQPVPPPIQERMDMIWLQFKVDSAFGHPVSALRHYQRYKAINDSVFNQTKSQQIAELGIRYETQKKEQDLLLKVNNIALLTQQSQVQQTQRNALLAGTALLVGLLGLGYSRYHLKQRSNQLLEAQQEQIHRKNQALESLLEEKERLLREIHHRVKNNLQIVMSLLNSQAASLTDQAALSAIQQSQHRVQAMALIHQKLYQSEGIARIPMGAYIQELVTYLYESYELPQPIHFMLAIDPVELDVTQAVPLGLIINEAITNALKYAFPNSRAGSVQIELKEPRVGGYELVIADDGVGLPTDFDLERSRSLGMTLIRGFSEQLGGQLQISGQPGLSIRLQFNDETYSVSI